MVLMMADIYLCTFDTGSYVSHVGLELYVTEDGLEPSYPTPKGLDYRYGSPCPSYAVWGSNPGLHAC